MNLYEVRYYTLSDGRGRQEVKAVNAESAELIAKRKDPSFDTFASPNIVVLEKDLTFCQLCNDYITRKEMRETLADDDTYRFTCPGCGSELLPPMKFDGIRF